MNQSIDLPIEILVKIIDNLHRSHIADYLSLRLVSSKWNYAINCHFESIKHFAQRKFEKIGSFTYIANECEVTKDGLIACKTSNPLDQIISCMKLLPNLTAVSVDLANYTKADQDTLFNYLNTRPTITSLELLCLHRHTKLRNDVKLENIRSFALNADSILSRKAIKRLFQEDHKLTQLYVHNIVNDEMPFEDGILILKRMPTLKRFAQDITFSNFGYAHDYDEDGNSDLIIYTKQPGLSFDNLESYSFSADEVRFLNYVDNFVACCPNLKNIDCLLAGGAEYEISRLDNLRVHTNVENLIIRGDDSYWEIVLKVLEMFPMIKNLKLEDMKSIGHNQISQALLKLPNLSLLYLRYLEEFPKRHHKHANGAEVHISFRNDFVYEDIVQVDCMALKDEYGSKFGRNLQIIRRDGCRIWKNISFRHGSSFMEKDFWPDWPTKLLTD